MERREMYKLFGEISVDTFRKFMCSLGYVLIDKRRNGDAELYSLKKNGGCIITIPGREGLVDKHWAINEALTSACVDFGWDFDEGLIKLLNYQYPGKYDWVTDGSNPTVNDSITEDENRPEYMKFPCTVQIGEFPRQVRVLYYDVNDGWKNGPGKFQGTVIAWRRLPEVYEN